MNPITEALDLLRRDGWHQKASGTAGNPRCLVGAITLWEGEQGQVSLVKASSPYPTREHWLTSDERRVIQTVIEAEYADRATSPYSMGYGIAAFNDHADTTFDDVERVLEKAALIWDESR